ncbi:MAG: DUF1565 domain-containing protein, partial [Deltaproteobacteria bacterium]|nr:DUF1565 domain-containing protein [Deltaproteobacteria bacterium]
MMRALFAVVGLACCLGGCDDGPSSPPGTTTSVGGGGGAGGGEAGCPPGTVAELDGSCEPAGTPADQCGEGFEATGFQSCEPILPTLPCPLGTMAVPGEDSCQPIADCGTGTWGAIETESNTQHVDDSYTLGDSDGTAAKPWPTITAAMAAAAPGATVAIAQGDYPAALVLDKPITLWGRCPDLVNLGANSNVAVTLGPTASGATLRGVTLGPAGTGVFSDGATAITLRELRVRQPATVGIALSDGSGPATATVQRVAIEEVSGIALRLIGQSEVTAEELYTVSEPTVDDSSGIRVFATPTDRANLVLRRATLIGHRYVGVHVAGADADLESVAILPGAAEEIGQYGLQVIDYEEQLATLAVRESMVSGHRRFAIMARGAQVAIERTLFRDARIYCEPADQAD